LGLTLNQTWAVDGVDLLKIQLASQIKQKENQVVVWLPVHW
jgi:hypothetical protein